MGWLCDLLELFRWVVIFTEMGHMYEYYCNSVFPVFLRE